MPNLKIRTVVLRNMYPQMTGMYKYSKSNRNNTYFIDVYFINFLMCTLYFVVSISITLPPPNSNVSISSLS